MNPLGTRHGEHYRLVEQDDIVADLASNLPAPDGTEARRAAEAALLRLVERGLPFRADGDQRLFDPYEAINYAIAIDDPIWRGMFVPSFRRRVALFQAELDDPAATPRDFEVRLHRQWWLDPSTPGKQHRLGVTLPLDDAWRKTLDVEVTAPGATNVRRDASGVDLRVRTPEDGRFNATVRLRVRIACQHASATGDVDDPARWLRGGFFPDSPALRARAERCAARFARPDDRLRALWDDIFESFVPGWQHVEDVDGPDPVAMHFELGRADCRAATSILIQECQSLGIPARMVGGMVLHPEYSFDKHFWMEAFLPDRGWVPYDFGSGQFLAGGSSTDSWATYEFGRLGHRLVFDRYPSPRFDLVGVKVPRDWYRRKCVTREGRHVVYCAASDRRPLYADTLQAVAL